MGSPYPAVAAGRDQDLTDEHVFQELRDRLSQIRQLRLCPPPDREDAVHDVIVRLLERAKAEGICPRELAADEEAVRRSAEAERSRHRRRWNRRLQLEQATEYEDTSSSSLTIDEIHRCDVHSWISEQLQLTPRDRLYLRLTYVEGINDVAAVAERMEVSRETVYRLKHKLMQKLRKVPSLLEEALGLDNVDGDTS